MNGGLQHAYGFVVDTQRHRERMPVLSSVSKRESRGVGEAVWGSMHNLGDHSQGLYCSGSHSGSKQQFRKVGWTTVSCRRQISMQPLSDYIAGANIVMCRQVEMWKHRLSVESGCGAVVLGRPCRLPPLSSGGALVG